MSYQLNKSDIRKTFLSKRKEMTEDVINLKSEKINKKILEIVNEHPDVKSVGLFYPFDNEVKVLGLCESLEAKKIHITLPVVKKNSMPLDYKIYSYEADNVASGYKGILEPIHSLSLEPDVIVVSCTAFNTNKYRVGYGGGFFDRTIEKLKKKNKNFFTILAAFDMQECEIDFQEEFDQKIDFICTENRKI